MPELGSYGSVRGARGNSRPYREHRRSRIEVVGCPLRLESDHSRHEFEMARWANKRHGVSPFLIHTRGVSHGPPWL